MVSKNSYMRKFVILKGRKTSYSDSNKTKGHVKIEVRDGKGKLAFNVEGLKHIDDVDKAYKGYLVSKEQNHIIKTELGALEINKNGQGKAEWKIDPEAVGNSGIPLDRFQSIVVTLSIFEEDEHELDVLLVGFIDEKDGDTEKIIEELKFSRKEVQIKEESDEDKDELQQETLDEMEEELSQEKEIAKEYQAEDVIDVDTEEKYVEQEYVEQKYVQQAYVETEDIEDIEDIENIEDRTKQIENTEEVEETKEVNEEKEPQQEINHETKEDDAQEDVSEYQEIEIEPEEQGQQREHQEAKFDDQYIKIDGKEEEYFVSEQDKEQDKEQEQGAVDWFNSDFQNPYGYSINKDVNNENSNQIYNYQITKYTLNILKFFEKVEPFKNELKGYDFWEIDYDEDNLYRGFLPYYDYVVSMYYPYPSMYRTTTCQGLIKKYKHYIFGVVMENEQPKHYIYGIPGKFKSSEHPYRGSTGFTTWLQGKNYENDKLGYWLLHIDTTTGRVTSPLRTTKPR